MNRRSPVLRHSLAMVLTAALFTACTGDAPVAPHPDVLAKFTAPSADEARVYATLRRVTARYHNIDAAFADGFVLVHPCEARPGEGPVGLLYANFERVGDGLIDPELPDGLIYEPTKNGRLRLVGVELAVPYETPRQQPPEFLGSTFQPEDEFQVYGLHVWVWRHNPDGMMGLTNPNVTCDPT